MKENLLSLPRDTLVEMFSFLDQSTIRLIMETDAYNVLNDRHNIDDYFCSKHGTLMKLNETKSDIFQKIISDGLDPNIFIEKLEERTESFDPKDWIKIEVKHPFRGKGEIYRKYLEMISECQHCEKEAKDAEMAKCGLKWCSECERHIWWEEFSCSCSNTKCSKNGTADNICLDCVDERYCEFCSSIYCSTCALNENSVFCEGCYMFSCGSNNCNGNDRLGVLKCKVCGVNRCIDCQPYVEKCFDCRSSFCEECREVSFCEDCNEWYCNSCRVFQYCSNCGDTFCAHCNSGSVCISCD